MQSDGEAAKILANVQVSRRGLEVFEHQMEERGVGDSILYLECYWQWSDPSPGPTFWQRWAADDAQNINPANIVFICTTYCHLDILHKSPNIIQSMLYFSSSCTHLIVVLSGSTILGRSILKIRKSKLTESKHIFSGRRIPISLSVVK